MKRTKTSPLPWRISDDFRFLLDADDEPVADLGYFQEPHQIGNAELIVAMSVIAHQANQPRTHWKEAAGMDPGPAVEVGKKS